MSKEREAWLALPARQRVELGLSSAKKIGGLFDYIRNSSKWNISGSAYQCHPQCHFRDGILLVDHWKTWGCYEIKIANNPSETPTRGCQDSMSRNGDPYPQIKSGWTSVWKGSWTKEGPWCEKIKAILIEMTGAADEIYARQEAEQKAAREAQELEKRRVDDALLQAWS
jgi:hypothetical protein